MLLLLNPTQTLIFLFSHPPELFYPTSNSLGAKSSEARPCLLRLLPQSPLNTKKRFYSLIFLPSLLHCFGLSHAKLHDMQRSSKTSIHHSDTQNTDMVQGLEESGMKKARNSGSMWWSACLEVTKWAWPWLFCLWLVGVHSFQVPCLLSPAHSWLSSLFLVTIYSKIPAEYQPASKSNFY